MRIIRAYLSVERVIIELNFFPLHVVSVLVVVILVVCPFDNHHLTDQFHAKLVKAINKLLFAFELLPPFIWKLRDWLEVVVTSSAVSNLISFRGMTHLVLAL